MICWARRWYSGPPASAMTPPGYTKSFAMSITTTALFRRSDCWNEDIACLPLLEAAGAGGPIGQRLGPAEMPDRSQRGARKLRRPQYNLTG